MVIKSFGCHQTMTWSADLLQVKNLENVRRSWHPFLCRSVHGPLTDVLMTTSARAHWNVVGDTSVAVIPVCLPYQVGSSVAELTNRLLSICTVGFRMSVKIMDPSNWLLRCSWSYSTTSHKRFLLHNIVILDYVCTTAYILSMVKYKQMKPYIDLSSSYINW